MTPPLINADQTYLLLALFSAIAAALFYIDKVTKNPFLSGSVLLFVIPPVLSNLSIIPFTAPLYDTLWTYALMLGLPLVLLSANLKAILTRTGAVLITFLFASAGVVAGAFAAFPILDTGGGDAAVAGTLTASYIGGAVNFGAVAQALELDNGSLLAATLAADNLFGPILIAVLSVFSGIAIVTRRFALQTEDRDESATVEAMSAPEKVEATAADFALLMAISFSILAVGVLVGEVLDIDSASILVVTVLSILFAQVFPNVGRRRPYAFDIGMFLFYLVFLSAFAGAQLEAVIAYGPKIFLFIVVLATVQLVFAAVAAKVFKLSFSDLTIGVLAAAMGPTIAAAFASSKGWRHLVAPGLLAGLLGYVLGNFAGLFVGEMLTP